MQRETGSAALIIGASGGIGAALVARFLADNSIQTVIAVSRSASAPNSVAGADKLLWLPCDSSDDAIAACIDRLRPYSCGLRRIVVTCGILHTQTLQPEKSLQQIRSDAMLQVLRSNLVVPALWLGGLASLFTRSSDCVIAVLSARVGSIADNRLGGWYSYRSSKAGLNMCLKTASIELARRAPGVKLIAFHPGTTDTPLSAPFQHRVPAHRLFTPAFAAQCLTDLMTNATRDAELSYLAWDGAQIPW
ncbi:MAG: SDR family NAD(P)-dependent oxidoreductase [Halioglobus sp.]